MTSAAPSQHHDVTVIGGGLAGKAVSIQLAKAGFQVLCIEPNQSVDQSVGESLDWSAPELLRALGLPMEELVQSQVATWKRHVTLKMRNGCSEQYIPSAWLGEKPFRVELRTLHVDRVKLDQALLDIARRQGVEWVHDKVTGVERDGKRIRAVVTANGSRIASPWFVDASGFGGSPIAREFNIRSISSGPPKVAMWTYYPSADSVEGTILYIDPSSTEYLEWVWEIPIQEKLVSVGYVLPGAAMKAMRTEGMPVEEIFRHQLTKFPRLAPLLRTGETSNLHVTSFRCRAHKKTAGLNWMMAGEAASMVDPITSNGVTAALRHATEAASLIQKYRSRGALPLWAQASYSTRILLMAKFFNRGIEQIVYEPPVRNHIGLARSGMIYTGPAWSMNAVYARFEPKGILGTSLIGLALGAFRAAAWACHQYCRMTPREPSN